MRESEGLAVEPTPPLVLVRRRRPHGLHEQGNRVHRVRVEHSAKTILVHLSDEDGSGWTVLAVGRATRRHAVAQARRQIDAAAAAYRQLCETS